MSSSDEPPSPSQSPKDRHKGERRGPALSPGLQASRKAQGAPPATSMRLYRKDGAVGITGMGRAHSGRPHACCHGNAGGVSGATQHAVGTVVNKVKGKILAKRIQVCNSTVSTRRAETVS
ncbi:60S ribosomal protein L21 [Galemys pyrenaicus]|uniref:60S ribosomal protein L21 n=1 Tax=Galemys pyrenaicus TaxID=202257 RepID=A0A8J6DLS1_GALPY|nr:60S ribosomal protein L21 [Galemys pyrenaicus]